MFSAATKSAAAGSPSDPFFKYVAMLLPGNGTNGAQNNTFIDSSSNNFSITRSGNTTQGTFSPYDVILSNYFIRSSSQYLTVSNAGGQFSFGTGAFTIECFVFLSSMPSSTGYPAGYWIFGGGPANADVGIDFYINNTQIGFNLVNFTAPTIIGNHGMVAGNWYHLAVVRGGTLNQTMSIFVNGTRVATASAITASADAATTGIAISAAEPSGATSGNLDGYISNYRIVKGSAVYDPTQTTITVPTGNLSAIANTQLLTCQSNRFIDNSANNLTITIVNSPSIQGFGPFNLAASYNPSNIGGSAYFDGTTDFLTAVGSGAVVRSSGSFTIEGWYYPTSSTAAFRAVYSSGTGYATAGRLYIGSTTSATEVRFYWNSTNSVTGTVSAVLNAWNHFAVTWDGTTTKIYINGQQSASTTSATYSGTVDLSVGESTYSPSGFISNFRVVGSVVYTAAFTPPTAPVTAIANTQLLLNMTNAGIIDNAMSNDLETVGNAQISTSQSKFGGSSINFNGTNAGLFVPSSPQLTRGAADFTIEFWYYPTSTAGTNPNIMCNNNNTSFVSGNWSLHAPHSSYANKYSFWVASYATNAALLVSTSNISLNTWTFIAITRSANTWRMFINGTSEASATFSGVLDNGGSYPQYIGFQPGVESGRYITGFIDDLRFTKGYARYTANFTPPTTPFLTR